MPHGFPRSKRIADSIKRECAAMLLGEIKDPRVQGLVTVMDVEVSDDLRHAKVFVSVIGDQKQRKAAVEGLTRAAGFVRKTLGSRLDLKRIPELSFRLDSSQDTREKIERLLAKVRDEERTAH